MLDVEPPRRGRSLGAPALDLLVPVGVVLVILVLWEGAARVFAWPAYLVPRPSDIAAEFWGNGPVLARHALATGRTILFGFLVSVAVSFPLAVAITASPTVARGLYPLLVVTQAIPKVALAPILVVLLGASELPRVVITFLVAFFPLVLAIATGFASVPPELIELGRACRASRWKELTRIRLPYAVPFVFSGLKAAITLAVVGAVVAEFVNADQGLGYLIVTSTAFFKVPLAWAALTILALIGIVLFQAVALAEAVLFPWASAEHGRAN